MVYELLAHHILRLNLGTGKTPRIDMRRKSTMQRKNLAMGLSLGISLGVTLGVAFGEAIDNLGKGIGYGVAIGVLSA